jgi:hypothetical protein
VSFVIDRAVEQLEADRHALVLGMGLDPVAQSDTVIRPFRVTHAAPAAGKGDQVRTAAGRAFIERRVHGFLDGVVIGPVIEAVGDRYAAGWGHGRDQPVFVERRPVASRDQVEAIQAQARGFAAHIFERHPRPKHPRGDLLAEASFR